MIFPVAFAIDPRFNFPVPVLDRLLAALRRCCHTLPDGRRGKNGTYAMADFALAAFAPFFMQSPSFLAYQRHLETGHGRSNCQTLRPFSRAISSRSPATVCFRVANLPNSSTNRDSSSGRLRRRATIDAST